MKQYNAIKTRYPGALLLFRVGDFYETFGEDAITASKILDITLTKRGNGSSSETALAGFPHHSLDNYLPKLVRAGQRVAICDQLEDPKSVKGIVKRGVTELVTPGVSYNDHVLDTKQNNYLAAIHIVKDFYGISFLDISTGEFIISQGDKNYIEKLLQSLQPSEILYCKKNKTEFIHTFGDKFTTFSIEDWVFAKDYTYEQLTAHFGTASLKGFGIEELELGIIAAGVIFFYLKETEHKELAHITSVSRIDEDKYVWLDKFTIRNLELIVPQNIGATPLINIFDKTHTPMGSRLLKRWLVLPLKELNAIQSRLNIVSRIVDDSNLLSDLNKELKHIGDLERLISKVAVRRINPRELMQLKRALSHTLPIKQKLKDSQIETLCIFADQLHPCDFLIDKISKTLKEELPLLTTQGNIINNGIDQELDELRTIAFSGKDYLLQIQQREIQRTGINSLKIAYNKVFGYYLEVTNTNKDKVPTDWIRKQTLANAERYITEELKIYEEKILTAEDKINQIEFRLFNELVNSAEAYVTPIQQNAKLIAQIDCFCSFASTAITNNYCKPELNEGVIIDIKDGRHPVIEKQLPIGEAYIANDVLLDSQDQQIIIITGPNMAGKSALLRQTALITLLAQIGSYVPATSASIGIVDKIFTRVGASDNLSQGESTFMVEMHETASILNNISEKSLILMDEIGRGTSTYDGISIAWSIVEFLHHHPKARPRTLFATHYHELNQLANDFPRVKNFNVSVKEVGEKIVFLRKLKAGGSEHSFGIHVAQLAGMPNSVVLRASQIMHHLEKDKIRNNTITKLQEAPKNNFQLKLFEANNPYFDEVVDMLNQLDINSISPVEALLKLNEIKLKLKI
ncbi:MAG: DNA mismatch repair protein MutS [Cytophagales bacterium]|nr:MAG: DNA mismatch repair protein MutS [Cytophagales bacterium]